MEQDNKIVLFQESQIRRLVVDGRWFFNLVDVIGFLTDSPQPRVYWSRLRKKILEESGAKSNPELFPIWKQLKFKGTDGKFYRMDAADTEGVLRIVMSVPSPKAEPLKLWLSQVGREHIEEIENPELGIERIRAIYKAKGYADEWIDMRLKSIDIRKQLTDEWQQRGIKEGQEYAILTAEIAKATFGLTPSEHKNLKNLDRQNLRDHMTNLELIFSMLGEEATRTIAVRDDAQGFPDNYDAAARGGTMAGNARRSFEQTENVKVVSAENFLQQVGEKKENTEILPKNSTKPD